MPTNCGKNKDAWERWKEREERKGCSYILISNIYIYNIKYTHIQLKYKKNTIIAGPIKNILPMCYID